MLLAEITFFISKRIKIKDKLINLEKKYIMYGLINEDESKETGAVLLGEVVGEGEDIKVLGILPEEKDMVVAYYNEISTQLGEDDNA